MLSNALSFFFLKNWLRALFGKKEKGLSKTMSSLWKAKTGDGSM